MIYAFDAFEFDTEKLELRHSGQPLAIERQVFALIWLLIENRERVVTKDELTEKIWDGRAVSDAAITSRIKSARQALGDDGKRQHTIKTLHGHGVRFVKTIRSTAAAAAATAPVDPLPDPSVRPSIAILPFRLLGDAGVYAAIAEAIPHDLITGLARLRWLFVIARGSSFRFRATDPDIEAIGRALRARYCLSGVVEVFGKQITVAVELADTEDAGVVWADRFNGTIDAVHDIRSDIVAQVVAALDIQIPLNEARRAGTLKETVLDAWSAYHLGLRHMYRFNRHDNVAATRLFTTAIEKQPNFARAHAGLSFSHFQRAFMKYDDDPHRAAAFAADCAEAALAHDPHDPFANFNMGRAFWLQGDLDSSRSWLERATELNPNYAQGYYARAWTDTVAGRSELSDVNVEAAMALSPLDPLRYAMLGTRALACLSRGDTHSAVAWADRANRSPGAHVLIAMIAVAAHALDGDEAGAAEWARNVRSRRDDLGAAEFFASFPFTGATRERLATALARHGF